MSPRRSTSTAGTPTGRSADGGPAETSVPSGLDTGGTRRTDEELGLREIREPRDLRALTHPTRIALIDALTMNGPLTATQAADIVGESPSSCSFHLRTLARHGFVEETGEGVGRNRPWRILTVGMALHTEEMGAQAQILADGLGEVYLERSFERLAYARAHRRDLAGAWSKTQSDIESVMWLTPDEMRAMNDEVLDIALKYRERLTDPSQRPAGAEAVEMLYFAFRTTVGGLPDPYAPNSNETDDTASTTPPKPRRSKGPRARP